ncbi:MAG: SDR family oxidoreductase [Anaerolineales bacterium]|jgi:NAD(P)-dependent dehydrogenase (short-subunit alcohol dehydrogenase family)
MENYPLALVTGAAHRVGRTFALTLARQGYAILLHYHHSAEEAAATAEEVRTLGVPVYPMQADLTEVTQIRSLFSTTDSLNFRLKVLVNSAAWMKRTDLRTVSADEWDASLNLNLRAPFLLAQFAAQRMTEGGLIVNVSDAGAGKAWTGFSAYLVSKAGLEVLTRLMAKTYAPTIRVNAIAPGLVLPSVDVSTEEWEKLVDRLPLKHPASLDEIAYALEFLLKNESVTGQTIVVDGGYSLI